MCRGISRREADPGALGGSGLPALLAESDGPRADLIFPLTATTPVAGLTDRRLVGASVRGLPAPRAAKLGRRTTRYEGSTAYGAGDSHVAVFVIWNCIAAVIGIRRRSHNGRPSCLVALIRSARVWSSSRVIAAVTIALRRRDWRPGARTQRAAFDHARGAAPRSGHRARLR